MLAWLRGLYRLFTTNGLAMRRFANPLTYLARKILFPLYRIPVTIRAKDGARYDLRNDPLDDSQLELTYGHLAPLYFPDAVDGLRAGGLVLDVGSFHGHFTIAILKKYPLAKAIAIEPDPRACAIILENLKRNGLQDRAQILEGAVGAASEDVWLAQLPGSEWSNYVAVDGVVPAGGQAIRVKRLDIAEICRNAPPDYVKCNAEGGEFLLFEELFAANIHPKWISVEMHPQHGDVEQLQQRFREAGYDLQPAHGHVGKPRFVCVHR